VLFGIIITTVHLSKLEETVLIRWRLLLDCVIKKLRLRIWYSNKLN